MTLILALAAALVLAPGSIAPAAAPPTLAADAKVFSPPVDPDALTGPPQAASGFARASHVTARAAAGDLVVARERLADGRGQALRVYRVRDGRASHAWTLAQARRPDAALEAAARDVADRFIATNNRGDADAFLALFDPAAKNFRNSGDPDALGDRPSRTITDAASRARVYRAMFAGGQQAQARAAAVIAFGDLVVSHDLVKLPDGRTAEGVSVYRVRGGRITHDWYIYSGPPQETPARRPAR